MNCVDWVCGKVECLIRNGEKNRFRYALCKDCKAKRELKLCETCCLGKKMSNGLYLCKKDNTYGLI